MSLLTRLRRSGRGLELALVGLGSGGDEYTMITTDNEDKAFIFLVYGSTGTRRSIGCRVKDSLYRTL